jgi:hypothetical protein
MGRRTTLQELRDALGTAKAGLEESRELAEQATRNLEEAEKAFKIANTRHRDRRLWAAHSRAALPGLQASRAALVEARGELGKRRKVSATARELVADGAALVTGLERAIDDRLNELERAALSGPELVLNCWD